MLMKISSDIIGNQNRDVPVCSAVTQPTAEPQATYYQQCDIKGLFSPVLQQVWTVI
jgi:hypothetical protein